MEPIKEKAYLNRGLFSEDYLESRLPQYEEWEGSVSDVYEQFVWLYEEKKDLLGSLSEAQAEDEFFKPALGLLGFHFVGQTRAGSKIPDYALFASEDEKEDAQKHQKDSSRFYAPALALAEVKKWNRSLNVREGDDPKQNAPEMQIVGYLQNTGVSWGILSNGAEWRLYHGDTTGKAKRYYSVDFEKALGSEEDFRRFYLFFRGEAFIRGGPEGKSFLERVLAGSDEYAVRVGRELKKVVFEDVFPELARGFLEDHAKGKGRADEETLRKTYRATLALLYRLLFLLYAEARDLLPVRDTLRYGSNSITKLKQDVAGWVDEGRVFASGSYGVWQRLADLFEIVDRGKTELNVPAYNGGLFKNDGNHELLGSHRVADRYLAPALDALSRQTDGSDKRFVDYGFVGVRELGSVYEGLLEFSLKLADEDLIVAKEKKKEVYKPAAESRKNAPVEVRAGEPYLVNDKKERKATGSYYTPAYIVNYIVENSLGPLVAQRRTALEVKLEEIASLEKELRRAGKNEEYIAGRVKDLAALETLLDVKVLDPAMGSGHFLVAAVDYLTDEFSRAIVELEAVPVTEELAGLRADIRGSLDGYGVEVSDDQLSDTKLLKRMVMKRCVYGVDLNEMAVELAKLSLWLDAFTVGAPLSFLDHHLKHGNSLIGSSVREVRRELEDSASLLGGPFTGLLSATDLMRQVGELSDATLDEVNLSVSLYAEADRSLEHFKRIMDIWTSQHFGDKTARSFLADEISAGGSEALARGDYGSFSERGQQVVAEAARLADDKHYFHWELEFPEVFYERGSERENPGFDAVIGNPPYVSAMDLNKILSKYEKPFWKTQFQSAAKAYDLYILFLEQATKLARNSCLASMITPNKFMSAPFGQSFREYVGQNMQLMQLLDLSHVRAFEDPSVYPVVPLIRCAKPENEYSIIVETALYSNDLSQTRKVEQHSDDLHKLPEAIWGFLLSEHLPLILKVESLSTQLQHRATVRASSTASEADAFAGALFDSPSSESKKFVNTGLIERFHDLWSERQLTHMGATYNTPYLHCSQPPVSAQRKAQYDKPKVVFAKMALLVEAFFDSEGKFASANTNFAYDADFELQCLTAVMNSKLMSTIYGGYFGALIMQGGYFQFQAPQLRVLPVPEFDFTTPETERQSAVEEAVRLYEAGDYPTVVEWTERELGWTAREGHSGVGRNDTVHDLLAHLAGEMTAMHRRRAEAEASWREWVAAAMPAEYAKLTKTFRERGWAEDGCREGWAGVLAGFQKKKAVPSGNLLQQLKRETEEALGEICPLRERIQKTDELIDGVVYRLYGLTEEEIRVVEGSADADKPPG